MLHRDGHHRLQAVDSAQYPAGQIRIHPHPFPFSRGERPLLLPDLVGHSHFAETVHEAGTVKMRDVRRRHAQLAGRPGHQVRDTTRMPQSERRFEIDEIGHGPEQLVALVGLQGSITIGCSSQRRNPDVYFEQSVHDRRRVTFEYVRHGRAELTAAPGTENALRVLEPTRPQMHLDDICNVSDVDLDRDTLSATTVGQPRPSQRSKT